MAIKLADTLQPMSNFPVAYSEHILFEDDETLQEKFDNGSLGGGGAGYKQLSQAEYDALSDDEKMNGKEYRTIDTGHIYKLGVEYGKEDAIYSSLSQLGLDTTATINDIIGAMKDGTIFMYKTDVFDYATEYNNIQYGIVTIHRQHASRVQVIMTDKDTGNLYVGKMDNTNKVIGWRNETFHRVVAQGKAGYFKFKPTSTGIDQPLRISVTDNYGGMINISGATPSASQYKPFKCIRLSNGEYTNYDAIKVANNKMLKLFYYDGYFYLKVTTYTTCTFTGLIEAPTYIETFDEKNAEEIPIRSVFDTPYNDGYADPSIIVVGDTASADGVIKTLGTLGFTGDIMTWDTGVYRVSHIGGLTNFPAEITEEKPGFRLEHYDMKKWGSNHNPNVSTYGCRQSVLHYKGNVFVRYTESGATAGVLITDTGWQKLNKGAYTSISELNSAKGTSISLTVGQDNTQKIIDALDAGEEFVEWYGNISSNNRFGIDAKYGNRINYFRVFKTNDTNGIVMAVTDFGKVFTRSYDAGTLKSWSYDKTKETLITNTKTLKLDVTKRNNSWYGAIKLTYLYDTSPVEVEISFRSATDDVRWAVINGQKYINKITYTQDSSNTAHYTIGIEFAGDTYGNYQAEVIGDFADINSLTKDAFTGDKTAVYYSPYGKNNGVTLVSAPEDIGLTFPCTSVQLAQAMRNKFNKTITSGAIGVFNCGGKTVTITDAPSDYGLLHIECFGHDRMLIRYDGIGGSIYAGSWIGRIKGSNGTFSGVTWQRIDNTYSVDEVIVGTWLDGKTIYRKTFTKSPTSDQATGNQVTINVATISGLTNVIDIQATAKLYNYNNTSTPIYMKIPFTELWRSSSTSSASCAYSVYVEGTTLKMRVNNCSPDDTYYITVDYIK